MNDTNNMNGTDELSVKRANVKREISSLLLRLFVEISTDRQFCKVLDACEARGYRENMVLDVINDANREGEVDEAA